MDNAKKFNATICVLNMLGAILVENDSEIGDSISSPIVIANNTSINTIIGIGVPDEIYGIKLK